MNRCILAELFTGVPIFPGENEHEQLACIMEVLGVPDRDIVNRAQRKKLFFGTPLHLVHTGSHSSCFRCDRRASSIRQCQG